MVGVVADQAFGPWGVVIATLFEVVFIFVFAELAPKIWAVQHSERAALSMAPFLAAVVSFPPLRWGTLGLIWLSNLVLPGQGLKEGPYVTEEVLLAMAGIGGSRQLRTIGTIGGSGSSSIRQSGMQKP